MPRWRRVSSLRASVPGARGSTTGCVGRWRLNGSSLPEHLAQIGRLRCVCRSVWFDKLYPRVREEASEATGADSGYATPMASPWPHHGLTMASMSAPRLRAPARHKPPCLLRRLLCRMEIGGAVGWQPQKATQARSLATRSAAWSASPCASSCCPSCCPSSRSDPGAVLEREPARCRIRRLRGSGSFYRRVRSHPFQAYARRASRGGPETLVEAPVRQATAAASHRAGEALYQAALWASPRA
jgi:hypothetical protein